MQNKHNFGSRIIDYLDGTFAAYAVNFIAIAYSIDLFLSGASYFLLNAGKLVWTSPSALFASVINLHTGKSIFSLSSAGALTGNHVVIVAIIGTLALLAPKVINGKFFGWDNLRSLRHGYLYAALYPAFAVAVHELLWYCSYVIAGQPNQVAILSSPMFDFGIAIIIVNFFLRKFTQYDAWLVAGMVGYYLGWLATGFPVTVNFLGQTIYFTDIITNMMEDGSWVWLLGFFILSYSMLRFTRKYYAI